MNKKIKVSLVVSGLLLLWWAALFFTQTKEQSVNYWWQAFLALAAILFGIFGLHSSKKWGFFKSGIGISLFLFSLGLIFWGLGQAGWTYYVIKYPGEEVPTATILDILYFSSIPLWTVGILKLSKATGAKYALRTTKGKLLTVAISAIMIVASYYFLVEVARGGTEYFQQPFIDTFWDLGYAMGDAINFTLALVIFGLSWKLLGGKFRKPIIVILASFGLIYLADFAFSYYDGKGLYFNGDKSDLLYLLMLTTFSIGLCMFDPSRSSKPKPTEQTSPVPLQPAAVPPATVTAPSQTPPAIENTTVTPTQEAAIATPQPNTVITPQAAPITQATPAAPTTVTPKVEQLATSTSEVNQSGVQSQPTSQPISEPPAPQPPVNPNQGAQ